MGSICRNPWRNIRNSTCYVKSGAKFEQFPFNYSFDDINRLRVINNILINRAIDTINNAMNSIFIFRD